MIRLKMPLFLYQNKNGHASKTVCLANLFFFSTEKGTERKMPDLNVMVNRYVENTDSAETAGGDVAF